MYEEQEKEYREKLAETLDRANEIRQEISENFGDSPTTQEKAEKRFSEVEKKIFSSMINNVFKDEKKAEKDLLEARNRLEEARLLAWKENAIYVQELTNSSINGLVKRTANLDLFHRLDVFNDLISSANKTERDEAIENYKRALSMKMSLWRDIDLIKKKSSFEYLYKIALPMVIGAMTAGITIYYFTRQIELVILAVFFSLVTSTGLFSLIKGKLGKESIFLSVCISIIIWLGASILEIDIREVIFSLGISAFIGIITIIFTIFSALKSLIESREKLKKLENMK
jgi:ABC-type multidrug transport system fused ATPase/permease subunit